MENKLKTNEIPHQASRLYIKLYCESKGNKSKETIEIARKSWLSLSSHKRKLFYETTENRNILNSTRSLCKSRIYLKEKYPKQTHKNPDSYDEKEENDEIVLSSNTSCDKEDDSHTNGTKECEKSTVTINDTIQSSTSIENIEDNNSDNSQDHSSTALVSNNTLNCNRTEPANAESISPIRSNLTNLDDIVDRDSDTDSNQGHDNNSRDSTPVTRSEPIPPAVKNGRELYNMIKKRDAPDFDMLNKRDRAHYYAAVRNLKKEYIKSYTLYLESLSKQDLFDHYMKTIY